MWKRLIPATPARKPLAAVQRRAASPWHAVSIAGTGSCCEAARNLAERRFLSREAPRLPLSNCVLGEGCRCSYQHHDDRRERPRRGEDVGAMTRDDFRGLERRQKRGRRATDSVGLYDWKG